MNPPPVYRYEKNGSTWDIVRRFFPNKEVVVAKAVSTPTAIQHRELNKPRQTRPAKIRARKR
jgi:hypothetical protein